MPENTVTYIEKEHVAKIVLSSASDAITIDAALAQGLFDACSRVAQNDDVYLAVLTGSKSSFCAGSELESLAASGVPVGEALRKLGDSPLRFEVAEAIALIDKPVIAAINGDALGQGLELALACDIRVASASAHLGFPYTAFGLMPMDGGTQRLPRLIGKGRALEMVLTGQIIDATRAAEIGLVSQVLAPEEFQEKIESMAAGMATKAPIAMQYVKEAVNKGMDMALDQGVRLEADLYFLLHTTADRTEGIRAFQEKRKPAFRGE